MRIVITGGAGFLGRRLCLELLRRQRMIGLSGQPEAITEIVLFDTIPPAPPIQDPRIRVVVGDIADATAVRQLIAPGTASIFHLAAVVSSQAEADFELGLRINLDGTRHVLDAARALTQAPRLIFTSSCATYGGALPDPVTDHTVQTPLTSYGVQKAACELLIADYSRRGFIDGRSLRLPTIAIRPGKPNKAASTWVSSIMREPLQGLDAICPVRPETRMAILSPRRCIDAFIRTHDLPGEAFGPKRALLLPSISFTAQDIAEAVTRYAGNRKLGRIHWQPDAAIQKIVDGWPKSTQSAHAVTLGFTCDGSIDEIIQGFIEDELGT